MSAGARAAQSPQDPAGSPSVPSGLGVRAGVGPILRASKLRLRERSDLPRVTEAGIGRRTSQSTAGALIQSAFPSPLQPRPHPRGGQALQRALVTLVGQAVALRAVGGTGWGGHYFPPSGEEVAVV